MSVAYEEDFHGWALAQADALRRRSANELDWENLQEEIESLGRSQRKELRNRLTVLIAQLLKWDAQSDQRTRSWSVTINLQRRDIEDHLAENPSLKSSLNEIFDAACSRAVLFAAIETRLVEDDLERYLPADFETAMTRSIEFGT